MKLTFILSFIILLSSCTKDSLNSSELTPSILAPIDIKDINYDTFSLDEKDISLPANLKDFEDIGLSINENEFYMKEIDKNQQQMANLKSDAYDIGVTFKNPGDETLPTKDAKIIELYVNQAQGVNEGFYIAGLKFGDSYELASSYLKDISTEESLLDDAKTIVYYTDKNFVSLYFNKDKLTGAEMFSKAFMRDENYVDGEFIIFGYPLKFPLTLRDLENTIRESFENLPADYTLKTGEEARVKIYSPFYNTDEKYTNDGILVDVINNSDRTISIKDADIKRIICENSTDASVGNIYVGAPVSELKIADKKNQNPPRLNILEIEGDLVKVAFEAENKTQYIFYMDRENIKQIEIIKED